LLISKYASTNENIDGEYVIFSRKEEPFGVTSTYWKFKKKGLKNDALSNIVKANDVVWNQDFLLIESPDGTYM